MSTPSSRSVEFLKVVLLAHRGGAHAAEMDRGRDRYRCDVLSREQNPSSRIP